MGAARIRVLSGGHKKTRPLSRPGFYSFRPARPKPRRALLLGGLVVGLLLAVVTLLGLLGLLLLLARVRIGGRRIGGLGDRPRGREEHGEGNEDGANELHGRLLSWG